MRPPQRRRLPSPLQRPRLPRARRRCFPWRRTRIRRGVATESPKAGHAVPWEAGVGTEVGRTNVGLAGASPTSGGGAPQRGDGTNRGAGTGERRRATVGPVMTEGPARPAPETGPTVGVDLAPCPGLAHGLLGHETAPEMEASAQKGGRQEHTARGPVRMRGPPTRLMGTPTTGQASRPCPRRRRRQLCRQRRQRPPTMARHLAAPSTPRHPSAAETMTSAGTA